MKSLSLPSCSTRMLCEQPWTFILKWKYMENPGKQKATALQYQLYIFISVFNNPNLPTQGTKVSHYVWWLLLQGWNLSLGLRLLLHLRIPSPKLSDYAMSGEDSTCRWSPHCLHHKVRATGRWTHPGSRLPRKWKREVSGLDKSQQLKTHDASTLKCKLPSSGPMA